MKMTCIAALLLAAALPARADLTPSVVGLHIGSYHIDPGNNAPGVTGWNNSNPGIYARWSNGLTIGHIRRNSLSRPMNYVAWTIADRSDRFALTVGLSSGYDKAVESGGDHTAWRCTDVCREMQLKSVIVPLLVPSVRIGLTDLGLPLPNTSLRLSMLLPVAKSVPAAHLSIEHRF